ncbi:HNH endonuclease family protein [Methylorubrum sp. SB2]|uniref:HNH endonuclease family protein n=1 Tax=Methylorubrum subtropicum TaxID=3138812 RepID=UPI00313EF6D7
MKIQLRKVTVRDLAKDYADNNEAGVVGYSGQLDIRPPYQREFIYKDKQRDAVIETVFKNFPLNVMYWSERSDDSYEVIDGQQRTISICQYVAGDFSYKGRYFYNLQVDEKDKILNYELMIYICSGTDSEKLDWFQTINIAGAELTKQELRNAVYAGSWVTDAKRYFSKAGCPAYGIGSKYITGELNRQAYLETAIDWISKGDIEGYMALHQNDPDASQLWLHFQAVIAWVKVTYPIYRKEMKAVPWGDLFNDHNKKSLNSKILEAEVTRLMLDEDVERKKGIYSYLLDRKEKHLSIRSFSSAMRREAYERQQGICPDCGKHYELEAMEADHITPWHEGGKTTVANCQMLCKEDNRRKGGR